MIRHNVVTSDAEIDAALKRSAVLENEPLAVTVEHNEALNLLIVGLSNGRRLVLPVEDVQGLEETTHQQMQHYELPGRGTGISFPYLDIHLYVPALIEGVYGNRRWMADLERKGGRATSSAKRLASRSN